MKKLIKAVITAAGLGTRLLSVTKELPKEMLPIFFKNGNQLTLKPMLQLIFEQLYSLGIRDFCFVIGRGKRAIEDHFTKDRTFLEELKSRGKLKEVEILESFYSMLSDSNIVWINQAEAKGFGDAVLTAKTCVKDNRFLVVAGDTYIFTENSAHLKELIASNADATLLLKRVKDPSQYGVAFIDKKQKRVKKVIEKPSEPLSKLAIMPYYSFSPEIFEHLSKIKPGVNNEVQLTDAIQSMIDHGKYVSYILLKKAVWLDIGNPASYWKALRDSYNMSLP